MVTERRACDSRTVIGARVRCRAVPLPSPPHPTDAEKRSPPRAQGKTIHSENFTSGGRKGRVRARRGASPRA